MNIFPLQLLLADDDSDDCYLFQEALINIPIQLTMVNDGAQLMQLLTQKQPVLPDMLFPDLNMPQKSGYQCLLEIKQNPDLKDLPVIILSTGSNPEEIEKLYKNGAHYFIRKPNDFTKLVHIIKHLLNIPEEKNGFNPQKGILFFVLPNEKEPIVIPSKKRDKL